MNILVKRHMFVHAGAAAAHRSQGRSENSGEDYAARRQRRLHDVCRADADRAAQLQQTKQWGQVRVVWSVLQFACNNVHAIRLAYIVLLYCQ